MRRSRRKSAEHHWGITQRLTIPWAGFGLITNCSIPFPGSMHWEKTQLQRSQGNRLGASADAGGLLMHYFRIHIHWVITSLMRSRTSFYLPVTLHLEQAGKRSKRPDQQVDEHKGSQSIEQLQAWEEIMWDQCGMAITNRVKHIERSRNNWRRILAWCEDLEMSMNSIGTGWGRPVWPFHWVGLLMCMDALNRNELQRTLLGESQTEMANNARRETSAMWLWK